VVFEGGGCFECRGRGEGGRWEERVMRGASEKVRQESGNKVWQVTNHGTLTIHHTLIPHTHNATLTIPHTPYSTHKVTDQGGEENEAQIGSDVQLGATLVIVALLCCCCLYVYLRRVCYAKQKREVEERGGEAGNERMRVEMMRVESLGTQCVRILHFVLVRTALYVYCPRHTLSIRITLYASPYTRQGKGGGRHAGGGSQCSSK
jgi:hypothetical protein